MRKSTAENTTSTVHELHSSTLWPVCKCMHDARSLFSPSLFLFLIASRLAWCVSVCSFVCLYERAWNTHSIVRHCWCVFVCCRWIFFYISFSFISTIINITNPFRFVCSSVDKNRSDIFCRSRSYTHRCVWACFFFVSLLLSSIHSLRLQLNESQPIEDDQLQHYLDFTLPYKKTHTHIYLSFFIIHTVAVTLAKNEVQMNKKESHIKVYWRSVNVVYIDSNRHNFHIHTFEFKKDMHTHHLTN